MVLDSNRARWLRWTVAGLFATAAACETPLLQPSTDRKVPRELSAIFIGADANSGTAVLDTAASNDVDTTYHAIPVNDGSVSFASSSESVSNGLTVSNGVYLFYIKRNGTRIGYYGRMTTPHPAAKFFETYAPDGKKWYHFATYDSAGNPIYHSIYDPQRNVLKIYHRLSNGTVVLVYMGPLLQDPNNFPPPDPPANHPDPWHSEAEFASGSTGSGSTSPVSNTGASGA